MACFNETYAHLKEKGKKQDHTCIFYLYIVHSVLYINICMLVPLKARYML